MPKWRSAYTSPIAAITAGNENTTIRHVTTCVQQNGESRSIVIPGALRSRIVRSTTAARMMTARFASATPTIHMSIPEPWTNRSLESGRKAVHPAEPAPSWVRKPRYMRAPPPARIHTAKRAARGAIRFAAPIWSGTR